MIFNLIEAEGLGCFANPAKVVLSTSAVNVIHSPNGTGKSTLFRALSLALFEAHGGRTADLQALRPWNSRLTPQVTVQFEHSAIAYRVRKRFLDDASAVVERLQGNNWTMMAQSDAADKFMRELLTAGERPRFNKPDSMGLAQILCAPQGQMTFPRLSATMVEQLRDCVGAQIGAADSAIDAKIQGEFQKVFTPTGRIKMGRDAAPQTFLRAERDRLIEEQARAQRLLDDFDLCSTAVRIVFEEIGDLALRKQQLAPQQELLRQLAREYTQIQNDRNQRLAEQNAAEHGQRAIRERVGNIRRYRGEVSTAADHCADLEKQIRGGTAEGDRLRQAWNGAEIALAVASAAEATANELHRTVELSGEFLRLIHQLANRLSRLEAAEALAIEARGKRLAAVAPSNGDILKLRATQARMAELEQKLALARVSVSFTAIVDLQLTVSKGAEPGTIQVKNGQPTTLFGAPNLCFEIEGLGAFRICGPISDYAQIHNDLEAELVTLSGFTQRFGVADADALQALRRQFDEYASREQNARDTINGLLCGETLEALRNRYAQGLARIAQIQTIQPQWAETIPNLEQLKLEADEQLSNAKTTRALAEIGERNARTEYCRSELELTRLQANLSATRDAQSQAREQLEQLIVDGISDAARQEALDSAVLTFDACRLRVADLDGKLLKFEGDPAASLQRLDVELASVVDALHRAEVSHAAAQSKLDHICAQSAYSRLAKISEELESAEAELKREALRTDALALLSRTFSEARTEILGAVARPIESAATQYLERICGRPLAEIKMTPEFSAESARPISLANCEDNVVSLDRLSGGEQEQIMLCTRLALAATFAQDERQVLVLDDVLTQTDALRLERICGLLDELSARLQIVILTCHPERFLALRNANRIDLERIAGHQQVLAA